MFNDVIPHSACYLNGEFLPLRDAKISVLDRGFIFGDGVYEVVPVYGGRLFRFDEHMARLSRSLGELRIANPFDREAWLANIRQLVAMQDAPDQVVYIHITRGVAPRDHVMPADVKPTLFMMSNPLKAPSALQRSQGVACISAQDFRWQRGDIKSISLLGNVMARQLSADVGAVETILLRDGQLTEAAACNVWVVKDGVLLCPPPSHLILQGIRVALVQSLCERIGQPLQMRSVSEAELRTADEILLSSATKEVLPVTLLDGVAVGLGQPGVVYAAVYAAYQAAKAEMAI
jgi:D-alanine transaminase